MKTLITHTAVLASIGTVVYHMTTSAIMALIVLIKALTGAVAASVLIIF